MSISVLNNTLGLLVKFNFNMPRHVISEFDRVRIVTLVQEGVPQTEIANRLHVNQSDVSRIWNRYLETNSVSDRPRSGRPPVTNERQNRLITLSVRRNPHIATPAIQREVQNATGMRISLATLRRRIFATGLRNRRPLRVPRLTPDQRARRLNWARDQHQHNEEHWNNVMFSDETRICLVSDNRRIRVWRQPGRNSRLNTATSVVPYAGGSAMFWAGIMQNFRTPLVHIPENLNSRSYIENILQNFVLPQRQAFGDAFIFMDDNARPHRSRMVNDYLEENNITRMDWPPNSPDQNPIEHAWDMLKRAIQRRVHQPRTVNELVQAAIQEWDRIPAENFNNLIRSVPSRLDSCIRARGGNTEY